MFATGTVSTFHLTYSCRDRNKNKTKKGTTKVVNTVETTDILQIKCKHLWTDCPSNFFFTEIRRPLHEATCLFKERKYGIYLKYRSPILLHRLIASTCASAELRSAFSFGPFKVHQMGQSGFSDKIVLERICWTFFLEQPTEVQVSEVYF